MNLEQEIARLNFKHKSGLEGAIFIPDAKITLRRALKFMEYDPSILTDPIESWKALSPDGEIVATKEEYIKAGANYLRNNEKQ